jgi:hypothetical protein
MVYIMWKNSKLTHREIVDPIFAKKYQHSRLFLISIPIAVSFVSFGGVMVTVSAISNGSYSRWVILEKIWKESSPPFWNPP